jgi:uncharacterized protein YbaP (TraB family)
MKFLLSILFITNITFGQSTIIWEVTDTLHHKTSFIVGTFHHIGNSFVDSIPILKTALLNAEVAIFESIDDESKLINTLQKREEQHKIEKLLSGDDFIKLREMSNDWKVNLLILKPIEVLLKLRQEFQLTKCKTAKKTDKWNHFDNYLIDIAKQNKVALIGLETDSLQLNILDDLEKSWSEEAISEEISFWISKLTNEQNWYEECRETEQYKNFEIDYEFANECEDDILVKKRNEEWMPMLLDIFSKKNCFLAVGLLHLKHNCGLLETFKRNGFNVKPIIIEKAGG